MPPSRQYDPKFSRYWKRSTEDPSYMRKIYLRARTKNYIWRYEILKHNNMKLDDKLDKMKMDIFWDLSEVNMEKAQTNSLRMTNLGLENLPDKLSIKPDLKKLDLSNNNFQKIPDYYFTSNSNLEILKLENNHISRLSWSGLSQLSNLKLLKLEGNPLENGFLKKLFAFRRGFIPDLTIET